MGVNHQVTPFQRLAAFSQKSLNLYRLIGILTAISLVSLRWAFPTDAYDPMFLRWIVGGTIAGIVAVSFVSKWVQEHVEGFAYAMLYLLAGWIFYMTYENNMRVEYVVGLYFNMLVSALVFRKILLLILFTGLNVGVSILLPSVVNNPQFPPALFIGLAIFLAIICTMLVIFQIRARKALSFGVDSLKSMYEGSPDAIFLINPDSRVIESSNSQGLAFLNIADGNDLVGTPVLDLFPELFSDSTFAEIRKFLSGKQDFHKELAFPGNGVMDRWGDVVVREIIWGNETRWLLRVVDITEKKLTQHSLQLSDEILQNVPSLILVTDHEASVIYASPSIKTILGYDPEEVMGDNWWYLTRPDKASAEEEKERVRTFAHKKPSPSEAGDTTERYIRSQTGQDRFISWRLSLTSTGNVIGVGTDVTAQRRDRFVKEVIYNIAEASLDVKNLLEFYRTIHSELIRAVGAYNIYIALQDLENDEISFPYYADKQYSEDYTPVERKRPRSTGLSEYVMDAEEGRIYSGEDLIRLGKEGKISVSGDIPKVWMGVPLMEDGKVIGIIATQDYENEHAFSEQDLSLLNFISGQIAHVISKLQADELERKNQKRYRAVTEAAFEGIAMLKGEFLTQANEDFARILGTTQLEIEKKQLEAFIIPEDQERAIPKLQSGNGKRVEFRVHGPNGTTVFLEGIGLDQSTALENQTLLAVRDISERKLSEEAEQSAKLDARFKSYVQNSSEIIAILNPEGLVQYVSPAIERILGVSPEEIIGEVCSFRAIEEDLPIVENAIQTLLADNRNHTEIEFRTTHIDESIRVLEAVLTNLTQDPLVNGVLVSARDITGKKIAEEQLLSTLSTVKATFESTKDAILLVGEEGECLNYNDQFLELFGMTASEVMDKDIRKRIALEKVENPDFFSERIESLQTKGKDSDTFYLQMKSGKISDVYIRPLPLGSGRQGRMWFFHDITEIKRAQEDLAGYLTLLETTFDLATDGVLVVRKDGKVLNYNRHFLEVWDLDEMDFLESTEETRFNSSKEMVKDPEAFENTMRRVENDPNTETFDVLELLSGKIIERMSKPLIASGEHTGRVWFYRDVTERILSSRAIKENEARYRSLFSQANDGICLLEDGLVLECNEKMLEMFDAEEEDVLGGSLAQFFPTVQPGGDNSEEVFDLFIENASSFEPQFFGWKFVRDDGSPFDTEVSLNAIKIDERVFIQVMIRDISEQVVTGKALRSSERRNKAILDAIPDIMFRLSAEGVVLDYKKGLEESAGISSQIMLGAHINEVFPPLVAENLLKGMGDAQESNEVGEFEFELTDERGEILDYEARLAAAGPGEFLIILRNVSNRKRTEKELRNRNFELDSFVYRASHDLKAPLNSLMGLIRLAKTDDSMERMPTYFSMMDKSVSKLDAFIRDLTDFSRNARMDTNYVPIDFREMVYDCTDNLKFMENADRVNVQLELNEEVPFYSDPMRMGIIFNNLISNGVKYFDGSKEKSTVQITVTVSLEMALISIKDNGIGIGEGHLSKVFDLFYRATAESFGSGLGLYIVKNAVDKLRGTIDLESKEGVGTEFVLKIPNPQVDEETGDALDTVEA